MEHWATKSLNIYDRWVLDVPLDENSAKAEIMKSELLPGG